MKKIVFYIALAQLCFLESCQLSTSEKPQIGDAAFYKFVAKQGDSIIYNARQIDNDTAMLILEETTNKADLQGILMHNIAQLSINDSIQFDLPNAQKGFLTLYKIVKAKDFPKYIAESNNKQEIFEKRLQEVKVELKEALPNYQKRQLAVQDSTVLLAKQYASGQLKEQIKKLPSGVEYLIIKGNGNWTPPKQKWVWFHYCGVLSNGTKLADSFGKFPAVTNLSEFLLLQNLEISAASFDEGNTVLLIIPPQLAYGDKQIGNAPPNSTLFFWVEVLKSVPFSI